MDPQHIEHSLTGRRWDDWMASLTQQTWVWASSGSWWRTRKPGMLQSMGHKELDTTAWLNWTELRPLLNNILKYYSTYKYLLNDWVRLFQFQNQKKDGNLHFWIFFHIHLVKWALLESLCGFLTLPLDDYHMEDICIISLHALIIQECCFCFKDLWRSSKWREGK